jgi:hypothetical protein
MVMQSIAEPSSFLKFWHVMAVMAQVSVELCCADAQLHDFEGLGRRW